MKEHDNMNISCKDIQSDYFDLLDANFGFAYTKMLHQGLNPYEVAKYISSRPNAVKEFTSQLDTFKLKIHEFWNKRLPALDTYLNNLSCLKGVFGGDIFPSYTSNIASSVGLYMDTIVLPDPLIRASMFIGTVKPESVMFYIFKHALNVMAYRELALADVNPPIVVIAPEKSSVDDTVDHLRSAAQKDVLIHSSKIFGRDFTTPEDLQTYLGSFSSSTDLLAAVINSDRLLFDADWPRIPSEQMQRYLNKVGEDFDSNIFGGPTNIIMSSFLGRMYQINDTLGKTRYIDGTPLMDAPTSWQYLLWKYEYDSEQSNEPHPEGRDLIIAKALQAQGNEQLTILANLPSQTLIDLRRAGAVAELREIMRNGINEISITSDLSLSSVTEAVASNINEALTSHKKELEAASMSRKKFFGVELPGFITVAGVSIVAAATGNVPLSSIAAGLGTLGAPQVKDIWKHGKEMIRSGRKLKNSSTGILFKHLNKHS